jgi:hypothetical protein
MEVRWKGRALPYRIFSKDSRVSFAAIVDNKRVSHAWAIINDAWRSSLSTSDSASQLHQTPRNIPKLCARSGNNVLLLNNSTSGRSFVFTGWLARIGKAAHEHRQHLLQGIDLLPLGPLKFHPSPLGNG